MPRSRGRDRYRGGKQAQRALAAFRAKYPQLATIAQERAANPTVAIGVTAIGAPGTCRLHGHPWRECQLCSKPGRRT